MKTCVDCKHFKGGPENEIYNPHMPQRAPQAECAHPQAATRDPIYGKALCHYERAASRGCGKKGRLWESKLNGS